jgi:hypothetical protein
MAINVPPGGTAASAEAGSAGGVDHESASG